MEKVPNSLNFDELFAVSDLHLGGSSGFQMFASTSELCALIKYVISIDTTRRVALVINGDFIDFLAEQPHRHFDHSGAITKLNRVVREDPSFAPIFEALTQLVQTENRSLIINLGNHDLELALPGVKAHLLHLIAGNDAAARGRITLLTDGIGLRLKIGEAEALFLHGNEFDAWNVTDHHRLRLISRDLHYGKPIEPWLPNAGTRMVIEIMNELKHDYPFIDLLKPEIESVSRVLLMIKPSLAAKLLSIAELKRMSSKDQKRADADLLSALSDEPSYLDAPVQTEASFMADLLASDQSPTEMLEHQQFERLGVPGAFIAKLRRKPEIEVLREALEFMLKDQSFSYQQSDETYKFATEKVDSKIAFLITGHTHLLRAIKRPYGGYFNSGTWARLIHVLPADLASNDSFKPVYEMLMAKNLQQLDAVCRDDGRRAVEMLCPAVHLFVDGQSTTGQLVDFQTGAYRKIDGAQAFRSQQ